MCLCTAQRMKKGKCHTERHTEAETEENAQDRSGSLKKLDGETQKKGGKGERKTERKKENGGREEERQRDFNCLEGA